MAIGFLECAGYGALLYAMNKACKSTSIVILGVDTINPKDTSAFIPLTAQAKFEGDISQVKVATDIAKKAALEINKKEEVLTAILDGPYDGAKRLASISKIEFHASPVKENLLALSLEAIGVVEINFYSNMVVVLDKMLKSAKVRVVSCHKTLGGRMVHVVIAGKTADVHVAMEAAKRMKTKVGKGNIKVAVVINKPHKEVVKLLNLLEE